MIQINIDSEPLFKINKYFISLYTVSRNLYDPLEDVIEEKNQTENHIGKILSEPYFRQYNISKICVSD